MNNKLRFELKYQLSIFDYLRLKNRLRCFVDLDEYSSVAPGHKYFVRSLYFDTFDYRAYFEKMTGVAHRLKLRIRTYFHSPNAPFVNVEIKTRRNEEIGKFSARVSVKEYEQFLNLKTWGDNLDPVLTEFERLVRLRDLKPKLVVEYEREAYIAKGRRDVRITFDHHMRYAQAAELFFESPLVFRKKDPFLVVLEIKCGNERPAWLEQVVRAHNLRAAPNSKYTHGIEQTQHAIFV